MTISVYFKINGTETKIADDNIMKLHQSADMFSSAFRLGATVCRQFDLDIDKVAFAGGLSYLPDEVILYEGVTKYATLVIDSVDTDNDAYYSYSLTDRMVRLGDMQEWIVSGGTFQDQIDNICTVYDLGTAPSLVEYDSVVFDWAEDMTARAFVGDLAEILGSYAYISADNELVFTTLSSVATDTISVEDCSSFKVDEAITYDRVVYDTPSRVFKWPEDGTYTGTGATYYINPDNQLMTDDTVNVPATINIEDEVKYIYSIINGFTFYNITVEKAPIDGDVKCGDCIEFTLDGNTYPTIAQVDWDYNSMWIGGYSLSIDNQLQEETAVTPLKSATRKISQYIDRELGEVGTVIDQLEDRVSANSSMIAQNAEAITQRVTYTDLTGTLESYATQSELRQTADSLTATFTTIANETVDDKLSTWVTFDASGITIGKSDSNIKGVFGNSSLDFVDEQGVSQAWLSADDGLGSVQLSIGDPDPNNAANRWRIFVSADGNHMRFTRHN